LFILSIKIMTTLSIVILAAGKGTRMHSDLPKVLQPLSNKPIIHYVYETANSLNPNEIAMVVGHKMELIKASINDKKIKWATQKEQLGTGHAVLQAESYINADTTLILYGDVPLVDKNDLKKLVDQAHDSISIMTFVKEDPTGYGRIKRVANKIVGIVEEKDCDANEKKITEINTGIMAVNTQRLKQWLAKISNNNKQKEYYLTDIVKFASEDGLEISSHTVDIESTVLGVNSKKELAFLERQLQMKEAEELMERGVTIIDPARIDIRGHLQCGKDVTIDVGCIFEGKIILGNNVHLKPYSYFKDCEIKNDSVIESFSHIDSSIIGESNKIGPYARLRPGAKLGKEVHIGNYVEIKNTFVDDRTKINHLSYIGDAEVGKDVNIGAGCITCNYDGAAKHKTIIGDDVFLGSDCQMIAPIKIGKGATIGAGSTLTEDVPANELTLSRSEQKTIQGWKRPSKK